MVYVDALVRNFHSRQNLSILLKARDPLRKKSLSRLERLLQADVSRQIDQPRADVAGGAPAWEHNHPGPPRPPISHTDVVSIASVELSAVLCFICHLTLLKRKYSKASSRLYMTA